MSAARTERLLNLLTLLLNSRRPVSLRELRELEEFQAYCTGDPKSGERAFERDKAVLVELGVPVQWIPPDTEGAGDSFSGVGGYLIDRKRYFLPDLDLSPGDRALLSIAGSAAAALDHFPRRNDLIRALGKLGFDVDESSPPTSLAHLPLQEGQSSTGLAEKLEVIQSAALAKQRIAMTYTAAAGSLTKREVDPYGLYYRKGVWYLVGHCHKREDQRTFHLGRIQEVVPARRKTKTDAEVPDFEIPDDFDLSRQARLRPWEYPHHDPITVRIRLAARLVPAIDELFGGNVEQQPDSAGRILRLVVTHEDALISALLPHGASAEVLEPPSLRKKVGDIYRRLAKTYGASHGC